MTKNKSELLDRITEFYVNSSDFNGLPARDLDLSNPEILASVKELVLDAKLSVNFGDRHPNPHIQAFEPEPIDEQVKKLEARDLVSAACLYPSKSHLKDLVDPSLFAGRPYALRLALGEPQLTFAAFDLMVLEFYRNDPRYHYQMDDISGRISVRDAPYLGDEMREADKVLLQTFGFAYDSQLKPRCCRFPPLSCRPYSRAPADLAGQGVVRQLHATS